MLQQTSRPRCVNARRLISACFLGGAQRAAWALESVLHGRPLGVEIDELMKPSSTCPNVANCLFADLVLKGNARGSHTAGKWILVVYKFDCENFFCLSLGENGTGFAGSERAQQMLVALLC